MLGYIACSRKFTISGLKFLKNWVHDGNLLPIWITFKHLASGCALKLQGHKTSLYLYQVCVWVCAETARPQDQPLFVSGVCVCACGCAHWNCKATRPVFICIRCVCVCAETARPQDQSLFVSGVCMCVCVQKLRGHKTSLYLYQVSVCVCVCRNCEATRPVFICIRCVCVCMCVCVCRNCEATRPVFICIRCVCVCVCVETAWPTDKPWFESGIFLGEETVRPWD